MDVCNVSCEESPPTPAEEEGEADAFILPGRFHKHRARPMVLGKLSRWCQWRPLFVCALECCIELFGHARGES